MGGKNLNLSCLNKGDQKKQFTGGGRRSGEWMVVVEIVIVRKVNFSFWVLVMVNTHNLNNKTVYNWDGHTTDNRDH